MRAQNQTNAGSPASQAAGVFDLSDAEGVTESERLLMHLCRKSFLSLWAHANLHTAQDMQSGRGSAKEFADVLVVFGDDVIIFSDKHIEFQQTSDLTLAWRRWFRRAITDSAKQLHGAMSWLRRFPDRIYLDAACTRQLPIQLPPVKSARYHLVAVTRGSRQACTDFFLGGLGTLQINTEVVGSKHDDTLFTIGVLSRDRPFVHVFDEFSLQVVMDEMDTITDFVAYLSAREMFLSDSAVAVVAAGEEQLIAAYISNGDESEHPFLPRGIDGKPDLVMFDDSHYSGLLKRSDYKDKRVQDEKSRAWDDMLERLIRLGSPKIVYPEVDQSNHETEHALRLMAAESRARRYELTDALVGMLHAAMSHPKHRRARVFWSPGKPDIAYIFLVTPKLKTENDEAYRKFRVSLLHAYCRCAKLRFPQGKTFIALGLDHPVRDYKMSSEDLIVFTCDEYTPAQKAEAQKFQKEFGILADGVTMQTGKNGSISKDRFTKPDERPKKKVNQEKRKSRLAQASRTKNRR